MFKAKIYEKKRKVFEQKKVNASDGEHATCLDCGETGHYFKCKLYEDDDSAIQVGTSSKKCKQSVDVKSQQQQVKRQKTQVSDDTSICSKCKQRGHKSLRSYLCDNNKAYARRLAFNNCIFDT
ncbi:hypothetical protein [Parasitella parasitica]|uniref:Uncharacterized protein n=1 Tax=Parasitella parasitica TaxID=35722 RepID=A0A0B7N3H1_9FUNG|nr:hypothetical protein [Parasitella parasitica]